jgi:hypothetical protein
MSQTFDVPTAPPASSPGRRVLIIIGIILVACCVLGAGFFGVMTLLGQNIEVTYLTLRCQEETGLDEAQCQVWVDDLKANHQTDMEECSQISGSDTDPYSDEYLCLEDRGLTP